MRRLSAARLRTSVCLFLAALVLPLAGCGGEHQPSSAPPAPSSATTAKPRLGDVVDGCEIKPKTSCAGASLSHVSLRGAQLSGANLSHAHFYLSDLSDADLSGADLSYADMRRTILTFANLSGANLSHADLRSADFSRTDLSDADLRVVAVGPMPDGRSRGADFALADLTGANIRGSDFTGAKFEATRCPNGGIASSPRTC